MNPLVAVVKPLNPKSKCAMFAAARAGVIRRNTWNGCAWNAAGREEGQDITSVHAAASGFGVKATFVSRFIQEWDRLPGTNAECTQMLIDAIEEVGLFTEPSDHKVKRIVREYAYKSQATKFKEQLESGELTLNDIPGAKDMEALLSA